MICEESKVSKTPKTTTAVNILGLCDMFFLCFLAFVKSKEVIKERAVLQNMQYLATINSKVKMKYRIDRLFKVGFNITNSWHHKSNHKTKAVSSVLHNITSQVFAPRKKKSYISTLKLSIYLFKDFYFFCFISTQFADFASQKIQIQITFAKSFDV